jgi:hypothetical protein
MKLNKLLFTTLSLLICLFTFSQEECGTDEILRRNPFLQELNTNRNGCYPEINLDTAQVLTLPVVFHIIHLGETIGDGTNISNEQIMSSIDNLNHRFRGDIESLSNLTYQYDENELSTVIDSKIEFCLAERDPYGNPTNGINRINGSQISNNGFTYSQHGISTSSVYNGVSDLYLKSQVGCWDVNKYINIYVVSEINGNNGLGGVQGFAYINPTNNCQDGIVCLYNVIGTEGNLKVSHNLNTILTHEMGHQLSLLHTFWSTSSCATENNPCTQGDQIPDTPPTITNNNCNTPNCSDAILENYMDYTPQSCRISFTQNQIERMRNSIYTQRYGYIYDNLSCQPLYPLDLGISNVNIPDSWCEDEIDFYVKIYNYGNELVSESILIVNDTIVTLPTILPDEEITIFFYDYILGDGIINIEIVYDLDQNIENNFQIINVSQTNDELVTIIVTPDVWFNETSWELTDEVGQIIAYGGDYISLNTYVESLCLSDGCYTFTIEDAFGDGISFPINSNGETGSYQIIINGDTIVNYINPLYPNGNWSVRNENFCVTICPEMECEGDFDNDGQITVDDLLILLTHIGYVDNCSPYDFNSDNIINNNDVLHLISIYGLICGSDEYNNIVSLPESVIRFIETNNLDELKLLYEIKDINYYNLLGQKIVFENYSGPYIQETQYMDGRKEYKKFFVIKN